MFKGPNHSTSQYGEIGWRNRRRKFLVPHLKALVKQFTPCVYTQNAQFLGAIFLGPQEGRICVATSDFVPLFGIPKKVGVM